MSKVEDGTGPMVPRVEAFVGKFTIMEAAFKRIPRCSYELSQDMSIIEENGELGRMADVRGRRFGFPGQR